MASLQEEYAQWKMKGGDVQAEFAQFRQSPLQRPAAVSPSERLPIGEVAGGMTGNVLGAPLGPATSVGLGSLGSGGGEAIQQVIEHATGSQFAPQTSEQAAKQIGTAMAYGTAADLGGRTIGAIGQRVLAPFRKTIIPEAAQTIQFLKQRVSPTPAGDQVRKQPLLPAEATESRALDIFENVS